MEKIILQSNSQQSPQEYLLQKKFEIMLEMSNKKLLSDINSIHSMIGKLNEEIISLKKQVSENAAAKSEARVSEANVNSASNNSDTNATRIYQQNMQRNQANNSNNEKVKPRYGDYTSEDVAIEKMFYFGNKR
ncbi:hypothetical protein HYX01_01510 [Candidatus Woesearchaeota archaeon]|nr:hypothetical protein [Candidatus Woesearchaeota archaeon]